MVLELGKFIARGPLLFYRVYLSISYTILRLDNLFFAFYIEVSDVFKFSSRPKKRKCEYEADIFSYF